MFTKTLLPDTLRAIKLVAKIPEVSKTYLAGGTALSLHLGHRISVDLDFFTNEKFNEQAFSLKLSRYPEFKEDGKSWQTIWGFVGDTKFSLFYYKYDILETPQIYEGIQIAGKKDIAAMKIHALEERGTTRDFIDVFFLAKEFRLEEMLHFYDQKYKVLEEHLYPILRSLSYFEDAEKENYSPKMLKKYNWKDIKTFFTQESKKLWKNTLLK